jgi:hypothetical protein
LYYRPLPCVAPKPLSALSYIFPGTKQRFPRDVFGLGSDGKSTVVGRNYLTRQATTLLKFAKSTSDPQLVAALVEKAVDLKSQVDETMPPPDPSPMAPDVERPA